MSRIVLVTLIVVGLHPNGTLAGERGRPDRGLTLEIDVEFALENGPVVYRVGLTNWSGKNANSSVFGYDAVTVRGPCRRLAGHRDRRMSVLRGPGRSS